MNSLHVAVKALPESVRMVLDRLGYHRPDIAINPTEKVSVRGCAGDGSRSFFAILALDGSVDPRIQFGSWGGANPFEAKRVDVDDGLHVIPPGGAVVTGETGGRGCFARLHVNPANMAPLLPAKVDLTERQLAILTIINGLKSSARAEYYTRLAGGGPTAAEFGALEGLGMVKINKVGSVSITTDGKNACAGRRVW